MFSLSATYSPNKQRVSPPSSPEGPRPAYSILCDETRTLMSAFLRKISSVLRQNQHRIEERECLAELEKQKALQAAQVVPTGFLGLSKRFFLQIANVKTEATSNDVVQLKPLLSQDIIEHLTITKNKFSEVFQVS